MKQDVFWFFKLFEEKREGEGGFYMLYKGIFSLRPEERKLLPRQIKEQLTDNRPPSAGILC